MKFETAAWIQDTRVLSPHAKGAWIDLICFMFSRDKGEQGTLTHSVDQFGRMTGLTAEEMLGVLDELKTFNICDVTPDVTGDVTQAVTLVSRRMSRDCHKRQKQNERKKLERERKKAQNPPEKPGVTPDVTGDVTPPVTGRGKRLEDREYTPCSPPGGDADDLELSGEESRPQPKRRKSWTRKQLDAEEYVAYPGFVEWWAAYPNATGKRKAFEAWVKMGLEFQELRPLLKSIDDHLATRQWQDGAIEHGSTFLNKRMFEDDFSEKKESDGANGIDFSGRFD